MSKAQARDTTLIRFEIRHGGAHRAWFWRLRLSTKLFVGGLAWATNDETLAAHFAPFGDVVEAKVITDRESGRSRGFGFVTYETAEMAKFQIMAQAGTSVLAQANQINQGALRLLG